MFGKKWKKLYEETKRQLTQLAFIEYQMQCANCNYAKPGKKDPDSLVCHCDECPCHGRTVGPEFWCGYFNNAPSGEKEPLPFDEPPQSGENAERWVDVADPEVEGD